MNLLAITAETVAAVNPTTTGTLYASAGKTTDAYGRPVPVYTQSSVTVQEQPLGPTDLRQMLAMNIQTVTRKAYLYGNVQGVNRAQAKGGDVLYFNGQYWLVTVVLETFDQDGWCSVGLTEQVGPPPGV
ncbi:MAG: hypothetical protein KGL35_14195 [Bradyrhizobium sp.]|nr:hypothetical protein [Bradyrhizobium sp.]